MARRVLSKGPMPNKALIIAVALSAPAFAGEWTERYFGVGSASDKVQACGLARDHAQGNSNRACVDRSGTRGVPSTPTASAPAPPRACRSAT